MLRACAAATILALLTVVLLPFQVVAIVGSRALATRIPRLFHRIACRLIGIRISVVGTPPRGSETLIVSNHCSWMDIPVISASTPAVFVAKSEIASWPLFGWLAKLQRSIFVVRDRRQATNAVNQELAARLVRGDQVVLFAEGTSSDGTRVLPFKSALIGAADTVLRDNVAIPHVTIQPLSIAYTSFHGMPFARHTRCRAAWTGRTELLPHLVRALREGAFDVTVSWGEPILYTREMSRKTVARRLEATVHQLTCEALRGPERMGEVRRPAQAGEGSGLQDPALQRGYGCITASAIS